MNKLINDIDDYGVLERNEGRDEIDVHIQELKLLGYTVLNGEVSPNVLGLLSEQFDSSVLRYRHFVTHFAANSRGDADVVRVLPYWAPIFFDVLFNPRLHQLLARVLGEYYIVNQVNGLINPANQGIYSQAKFHRDLPFRHLILSRPIALNALFALDNFTIENGATWVIPGSHHQEAYPSIDAVRRLRRQVQVPAGAFIVLDAMTYHAGGVNLTDRDRRAVNHVFSIPALRQQFHLPSIFGNLPQMSPKQLKILGFDLKECRNFQEWFARLT